MGTKCDRCDRPATVHEVTVKSGAKIERHLCEQCAREEGIVATNFAPINELITKFVMSHGAGIKQSGAGSKPKTCEACGTTFAEFKKRGLLGCGACYKAFEEAIGPIVERMQEGATHHVGKVPRRCGTDADRQERISLLRRQLNDAIRAEQYERAALLRDQLIRTETTPGERCDKEPTP